MHKPLLHAMRGAALAALLALVPIAARAADPAPDADAPYSHLSELTVREVLVDFQDDVTPQAIAEIGRAAGVTLRPNSPDSVSYRMYVGDVDADRVQAVVDALSADPRVESAQPNYWMAGLWTDADILREYSPERRTIKPDDPLYKYQWHITKIGMEEAWVGCTGKDVVVAVIDTGVAYEKRGQFIQCEDLAKTRFVKGWNYIGGNEHANDDHAHGTHVAGTIAQSTNNGVGVAGVAYNAAIMPLKVLSARGFGKTGDIAAAIRFAADHGANVINLSLGGPSGSKALEDACKYAHKKGVVVVCAAGNSNSESVSFPARYKECVAVSATRFDDQLTFYTNRGKRIDIAAPGGDLNVDQNGDGYRDGVLQNTIVIGDPTQETYSLFQGTSMASPHVAAAAALMVSLGVTDPEAVRNRLTSTARRDGLPDELEKGYGGGVLECSRAVFKTAFMDPLARFVLAFLLLVAMLLRAPAKPSLSAMAALGMVGGACGLFFLPWLGVNVPLLTRAVPDWDLTLAGFTVHANPVFWSATIPLALSMFTFGQRRMQDLCQGLAFGVAGFLLHQTLFTTADMQALPGLFLDKAWLLLNVAACLFIAYVLAFARKKDQGA